MRLSSIAISFVFAALVALGCTPTEKAAASAALDFSAAVCTELEKQPEPGFVYFTCAAIDVGEAVGKGLFAAKKPKQTLVVRVRKEDAPAFAALHRRR